MKLVTSIIFDHTLVIDSHATYSELPPAIELDLGHTFVI